MSKSVIFFQQNIMEIQFISEEVYFIKIFLERVLEAKEK